MMTQMMELSKPNENHKLLADLAGTWSYTVKFWMNPDPNAKPEESKGTAVRKSMMDGRYFVMDVTGKMQMPGPDGKKKEMTFKGMAHRRLRQREKEIRSPHGSTTWAPAS